MLLKTIATHDKNDEFLKKIRIGMEQGAQAKLDGSIITQRESLTIRALIEDSRREQGIRDWCMPVVVITTWGRVKHYNVPLRDEEKASSSSVEILCRNVPRSQFDVINLEYIMNDYDPFRKEDI